MIGTTTKNSFRGIMCAYKCLLWPSWAKKNNISADGDSRGWQGWGPNIHFLGWYRVNECSSRTKWGRSETLSNLTWWLLAKARECHGKCWVVMVQERDLRRKEKAAPLDIKVREGEDRGKALNSSPKANFRGEQRGLQSMYASAKGGSWEWGKDDGLEGGHHLRLKKRNQGCKRSTHTHPAVVPQAVTWNLHIYSNKPPQAGGLLQGGRGKGEGEGRAPRPCNQQQGDCVMCLFTVELDVPHQLWWESI